MKAWWALTAITLAACTDGPHVSGRVCIVIDLRYPTQCLGGQDVAALSVEELGTGSRSVTATDGSFRVDTPMELPTTILRVDAGRADRRTSIVSVPSGDGIIVPLIATAVWTSYVTTMGGTDDPAHGALVASMPPPGSVVASATAVGAAELFYNQGEAFDWAATPPGDEVVGILALGLPPAPTVVTITTVDDRQAQIADVPMEAGAITWIEVALP